MSMSKEQEKATQFFNRNGWTYKTFFNRPHWTRRRFFEVIGAGVTGSYLAERYARAAEVTASGATTKNTARNAIFILLAGAPSHTDTFDLKMVSGTTPTSFAPETINGILFPTGLLPNLANHVTDFALVRSMQSHALVHSLAQTWTQIGRNPAAALGNIAPNIGSVVAIEKDPQRQPGQVFPAFLALNSGGGVTQGYFPAVYAPFKVTPAAGGIANVTNPDGQTTFNNRWKLMHTLDDPLRINSPYGQPLSDYNDFYTSAEQMMYNPAVNTAFSFTSADSVRYGSSSTGNACLVAMQVLKANQGTRFVQITSNDGWDMHQNIYSAGNLPAKGKILDNGGGVAHRRSEGQRAVRLHPDRDGGRVRPHCRAAHFGGRPRPPLAAIRLLRRRRHQRRHDRRADQRHRRRYRGLWLVAEPLRVPRGHRGHRVLGHGHRLDHRAPRRSARARLRIRAHHRGRSLLSRARTLGVAEAGRGGRRRSPAPACPILVAEKGAMHVPNVAPVPGPLPARSASPAYRQRPR